MKWGNFLKAENEIARSEHDTAMAGTRAQRDSVAAEIGALRREMAIVRRELSMRNNNKMLLEAS